MAEEKETKKLIQTTNQLVGAQAQPTTLGSTTKLDIDVNKTLVDDIIQAGLSNQLNSQALENFTSISNNRDQMYQMIDTMGADSSVAAILKVYTEYVCATSDNGHIVWCESDDPKISKFVNYLLNVMNVDKNIFGWAYCLIKYGDTYLRLYRESEYEDELFDRAKVKAVKNTRLNEDLAKDPLNENVYLYTHDSAEPYSYYLEMVPDPGSMFELTKLGQTFGYIEVPTNDNIDYLQSYTFTGDQQGNSSVTNFRMRSGDVNIYQADDFVHAYLEENISRYPERIELFKDVESADKTGPSSSKSSFYNVKRGQSLLYDKYKVWREKALLEDAILLNRVTKSSIFRKVQVEVGNMGKTQARNALNQVKALFEQKSAIRADGSLAEYNNVGPIENFVYLTTHNGQGAVTIESVGGDVDVKNLADLDSWINKFYGAFGIPKQYFSQTDDGAGFNGGASLAITSSIFANGVIKIQNSLIQMITDAINLILYNRGVSSYINNFVLKMKTPLTQEEKDYRDDFTNRVNAISNTQSLFADVEDKARRLRILKKLIGSLNYGDEIQDILQQEIEAAEEAKKREQEAAEAEAAAKAAEGASELGLTNTGTPEEESNLELDLGNSSEVSMEGFKPDSGLDQLIEEVDLEESDFLSESDDLPTPEEADKNRDFSRN